MFEFPDASIDKGLPQLPANYWQKSQSETEPAFNVFDNSVKVSLDDISKEISIFKNKES